MRIIVPSFSDSGLIFHASRKDYDELLAGGVRIYEQRYAMLHAKSMVIDTALSMVGSANFDMRSFLHNNEVNAVVVGSEFAQRMEALFERDLRDTRELELQTLAPATVAGSIQGIRERPVFVLVVTGSLSSSAAVSSGRS